MESYHCACSARSLFNNNNISNIDLIKGLLDDDTLIEDDGSYYNIYLNRASIKISYIMDLLDVSNKKLCFNMRDDSYYYNRLNLYIDKTGDLKETIINSDLGVKMICDVNELPKNMFLNINGSLDVDDGGRDLKVDKFYIILQSKASRLDLEKCISKNYVKILKNITMTDDCDIIISKLGNEKLCDDLFYDQQIRSRFDPTKKEQIRKSLECLIADIIDKYYVCGISKKILKLKNNTLYIKIGNVIKSDYIVHNVYLVMSKNLMSYTNEYCGLKWRIWIKI